ncbi:hypothetical protein ACHAXR_012736 [Thalassiosira sp. AJA248-18]
MDVDIENANIFDGLSLGGGGGGNSNSRSASGATTIDDNINSAPTRPLPLRLIYQSSTTEIYRRPNSSEGVKVILSEASINHEQVLCHLAQEQRMTNEHSPQSSPTRMITKIETFNGYPAFTFEWVDGVSLKDWLSETDGSVRSDNVGLKSRLRLATAITKTLHEYHEAGISHGKLSTSNIIVDAINTGSNGQYFTVAFIDLSKATLVNNSNGSMHMNPEGKRLDGLKSLDLKDLGLVMKEIFSKGGVGQYNDDDCHVFHKVNCDDIVKMMEGDDDDEEEDTMKQPKRKQGNQMQNDHDSIDDGMGQKKRERRTTHDDGLPMYISSFVSALLNACTNGGNSFGEIYDTAEDVWGDLKAATTKYDVYFPTTLETLSQQQQLMLQQGRFYGRKSELSMLLHSLNSVIHYGNSSLSTVSGGPGMGKTSLVNQIEETLINNNGFMIRAKFDLTARQPDCVICSALNTFLGILIREKEDDVHTMEYLKRRISEIVGPSVSILRQSIPHLGAFMTKEETPHGNFVSDDSGDSSGDDEESSVENTQACSKRSKFALTCSLIRALSSQKHPVVFFIDDLQWACPASLELVQLIAEDNDIHYRLCVISYRDDDGLAPQVPKMLKVVEGRGFSVQTIKLGPMERESANTLVSEALCLPPSLARNLSELVHSKTGGSALFVRNFLLSLSKDGLIWFNLSTQRWEYDLSKIRMTEVPPDVVKYLTMQMSLLYQNNAQVALKVAACFGTEFVLCALSLDLVLFKKAKVTGVALEQFLPTICSSGFICETSPGQYRWAHDQVRKAAYDLIPPEKRKMFHLLIGTRLLMYTPEQELEECIFDIVPHMTLGQEYLTSESQKCEVAGLSLLAGKRAYKSLSYPSAVNYFNLGINMLPKSCWESQYKLSLNLHVMAIKTAYCVGMFDQLCVLVSTVLSNGRTLKDKLDAHIMQVRYLTSTEQCEGAISQCLVVLEELGEKLPEDLTNEVELRYMHVKGLLDTRTANDILQLPVMEDERKLATMEFLSLIQVACSNTRPQLGVLAIIRMVEMTLEWLVPRGLCDVSAFSFAAYGGFLASPVNQDFEGSYQYGKIGLKVLDRFSSKGPNRLLARVYNMVFGTINVFREPYQDGYRDGCQSADLEYAYLCLQKRSVLQIHSGCSTLAKLEQELASSAINAEKYGQTAALLSIVVWLSMVLQMKDDSSREDPYMTYLNCTENALLQQQVSQKNFVVYHLLCNRQKLACLLKGNLDGAIHCYKMSLKYPQDKWAQSTSTILGDFLDGIIAFACAQKHQSDESYWTNIGLKAIEQFQKLVESSEWNFSHKLYLLEAEHHALKGNNEAALQKYTLSITTARKHHHLQEEGFAFERAGCYHLLKGRHSDAISNFSSAKECYERWGAHSLKNRMAAKCRELSC